jgi:hypothetical protein
MVMKGKLITMHKGPYLNTYKALSKTALMDGLIMIMIIIRKNAPDNDFIMAGGVLESETELKATLQNASRMGQEIH